MFEIPIRPKRRRERSLSITDGKNEEVFCGQFPTRLKRNFSTDVFKEVNSFHHFPPKRGSNLEISRNLSQKSFSPLFGPNSDRLMAQMWKPLRHSQVILPTRQERVEPKRVEKKTMETFEDHFNQYKSAPRIEVKESPPKSPRALSSQRSPKRKGSLPVGVEDLKPLVVGEVVGRVERAESGDHLVLIVLMVNAVLAFCLFLMIY